jgi:hypothetical protein
MKMLIAALCSFALLASPLAFAQDKDKKAPTAAQKKQQERMKSCNEKAGDKKGDERKKFMSTCLKADAGETGGKKTTAQQDKMKACNKQASDKKLKGDDRKKFMSGCLKG